MGQECFELYCTPSLGQAFPTVGHSFLLAPPNSPLQFLFGQQLLNLFPITVSRVPET